MDDQYDSFEPDPEFDEVPPRDTSAWTIPMLCIGIAVIACCVLIPASNENRRLMQETQHLSADLDQIKQQIAVNDQFLKSVADDPGLLERLAQRQMKLVRQGQSVLELKGEKDPRQMSPFSLMSVPPPQAQAFVPPPNGLIEKLLARPQMQLFAMGGALLLMAGGLVLERRGGILKSRDVLISVSQNYSPRRRRGRGEDHIFNTFF